MDVSDEDQIEKLAKRRRRLMVIFAGTFLIWQVPLLERYETISQSGLRPVDMIYVAGFLIWVGCLISLLAFTRSGPKGSDVQAALNDELTQANRIKAFSTGYWAMLIAAVAVFVLSFLVPVTGKEAAHLVLMVAVIAPLLRFARLERG
jgi:hypothetical protein